MMTRRKRSKPAPPPPGWTITTETRANGRVLTPGVEVSIAGEPGARFRFVRRVDTAQGATWLTVYGGRKGRECWRHFAPERVRTVHRLRKTRGNVVEEAAA